jgi:hypothetical protein
MNIGTRWDSAVEVFRQLLIAAHAMKLATTFDVEFLNQSGKARQGVNFL